MTHPLFSQLRPVVFTVLILMGTYSISAATTLRQAPPQAQPAPKKGGHGTEIRSMKIAFITEALQLTPEESQAFWPVYNAYWQARQEVSKQRRALFKLIREGNAGEQQAKELLAVMDRERKVTTEYMAKFRQILPIEKALRVFVADEDFKNFLVRRATGGGPKK